ncbi:MAG: response regulator transcription factor [Xanthomonadales bacterium]|jgi:DNA-binding NarL/FixJ family response regulator|nr:response regulator transcription factor [Xanthomonadales bacterium]
MNVKIALVDDQALVLKGLSALLGGLPGLSVTLEAPDAEHLLAALAQRPVEVIVSDIRMPGMGGIGLVRALRERGDATPVILLTTFDDSELMLAAVDVGAQGFLLKDAAPEDLRNAILRVAGGDTLLQPVSLGPVRGWQAAEAPGRGESLSAREVDILRLIAGGYSNKEIGRSLHLSEGTVKNYVTELLSRLDCRDRTHLVLTAIRRRLI